MGVPPAAALDDEFADVGVGVADLLADADPPDANVEPALLVLLTFLAFGSFFDVLNFRFLETGIGFDSIIGGDFLLEALLTTGSSDDSLFSVSVFSVFSVFGLDISTVSGVKAGGAAGLRCRFPSTLVSFSLPSLKPSKNIKS